MILLYSIRTVKLLFTNSSQTTEASSLKSLTSKLVHPLLDDCYTSDIDVKLRNLFYHGPLYAILSFKLILFEQTNSTIINSSKIYKGTL